MWSCQSLEVRLYFRLRNQSWTCFVQAQTQAAHEHESVWMVTGLFPEGLQGQKQSGFQPIIRKNKCSPSLRTKGRNCCFSPLKAWPDFFSSLGCCNKTTILEIRVLRGWTPSQDSVGGVRGRAVWASGAKLHSRPFILVLDSGRIINSTHNYKYLWCAWQLLVIWRNEDQWSLTFDQS